MPCRVLLDAIAEARTDGDSPALKALYAEDALIASAVAPDVVETRDEVFDREDPFQGTQLIGLIDLVPIDESAGLIQTTVRTRRPEGGYQSAKRVWLFTFKDGRIYRQRVLESRDEAADFYQRHGLELGMHAATP